MALPGTKAKDIKNGHGHLKLFLFGDWKVGKTYAATQFPRNYFVDTEQGATQPQYVRLLQQADSMYYGTNSFEEILAIVKQLIQEKHDLRTLTIDPISTVYSDLLEIGESLKGDEWGRHYGWADQRMKRLFLLLDRLDMNVIITSHAKAEYVKDGQGKNAQMTATGKLAPDAWKKLPYAFDLIVELRRTGSQRMAEVRGGRLEQFEDGDRFEWSYEEFVKRLGKDALEREATPTELIGPERLEELQRLLRDTETADDVCQKWLRKCGATDWSDISGEQANTIIDHLTHKARADKAAAAI